MAKCKYFDPSEEGCKVNCANCKRWTGIKCRKHATILNEYEESESYKVFDHMMRQNKGIRIDG